DQDSVLFDYSKAHSWYRLAATNGHRGAQSRLGLLFEFGKGVAQSRVHDKAGTAEDLTTVGLNFAF
ncbi:MAG: sel1 repeat family protein, partial [Planktomarina temperata]|nr:sel1 repeat family protein [Planktomarina temperata]